MARDTYGDFYFADDDGDRVEIEKPYVDSPDGHVLISCTRKSDSTSVYVRLTTKETRKLVKALKACILMATPEERA
jgi:hypothetical protein